MSEAQPSLTPKRRLRFGPVWLELFLFGWVLLLAALLLILASPIGTRSLFAAVQQLSGGAVAVRQVEGSLLGELTLLELQVQTKTSRIQLDQARLQWQPLALLAGQIRVRQLALGHLVITTQPSPEPVTVPASLSLPVALAVDQASLAGLQVDGVTVLYRTVLQLDSTGSQHRLRLQSAQTPWFTASGQLAMAGKRPYALNGQLALQGEAEGAPWRLNATLANNLEALSLRGDASGGPVGVKPFRAGFDLALRPFSTSPYGILQAGQLQTEAMDLRLLSTALPRTALDIVLKAQPQGEAVATSLTLRNPLQGSWPAGRLPLASIDARTLLTASQIQIQRFDAGLAGGQLSLTGTAAPKRLDLAATLSRLDMRSFGGPASSLAGKLALKGSAQQPQLLAQLADQQLALELDASLRGQGEQRSLQAKTLQLRSGNGKLTLTGELGLAGKRPINLSGQLDDFDPASLSAWIGRKLPVGSLNAKLATKGQLAAPVGGNLQLTFLPSRFNGQPLSGQLQADVRGALLQDLKANLLLGANRLNAQGSFGRPADKLQLDLQLPDIADFGPGFKGRLEAQLLMSGTMRRPSIEGTARSDNLRLPGDIAIAHANLAARFSSAADKPANSPLALKLDISGLSASKLTLTDAHLSLNGTQANHSAELSGSGRLASQPFELLAKAAGTLDAKGWRGRVDSLENRGDWPLRLNAPAQLAVSNDGGSLIGLDGQALGAKIRIARLEWHGGRFAAQGELRDVALAEWLSRLPDYQRRVATDLVLAARFDLRGDDKLAGNLQLERQSGDLSLSVDDPTVKPMPLKLSSARLQLDLAGEQAAVAIDLKSAAFGSAVGRLATRFERTETGWRPAKGAALEGSLQAEMPALGWVAPLLGPTAKVEGKLSAELTAGGVIGAPRWFGRLKAQDVALRLPDSGINWNDGQLEATLDGDTAQLATLSLKAGKGNLSGSGRMALLDAGPEGGLEVKFDHFGALTRPDRNLVLSGNASLGVQGEALTLTGKLTADEGLIELPKRTAAVLGEDVIVKGKTAQVRAKAKPTPLTLRLDLDLGKKFVFKGQGVDAQLSGLVRLSASPRQALSASGALKVEEGRYAAYGQNLAIERGIITFQGPLDNPALDILAERKNLPVVVGVKISGTALAPTVALTSDTGMADAEKLSWLVLGRGSASGGGDADLLITAADALFSASDSVSLRQQMAGRLGLDDISVGRSDTYTKTDTSKTDASGNALAGRVVSLGKRLSDKAYVSYEQSLDGVGYAVKLTYQLTRRVSLALTAGQTSSADVLYSWLFD